MLPLLQWASANLVDGASRTGIEALRARLLSACVQMGSGVFVCSHNDDDDDDVISYGLD